MPKLFGVTLFVSATLLFLVQPMVGKMILPLLGGTPAVWNTCMVFFQALLLAGYFYAHRNTSGLPPRRQVAVHSAVLLVAAASLAVGATLVQNHSPVPIFKSLAPQGSDLPFFGVILLLFAAIGIPFFTISTTAPLLQKWFSETGHPSSKDPYFLYAASNFGSLLALVAYPFIVEPNLRLVQQAWVWAAGFVVLVVLIAACGRALVNAPPPRAPDPRSKKPAAPVVEAPPTWPTRVRWLLLGAVPSSLMLAVYTDITTDIVSMPLLWIIPLALYLITFIIVFSKSVPAQMHLYVTLLTPVLVLLLVFIRASHNVTETDINPSFRIMLGLELAAFFFVALVCHGELARTRPAPKYLTGFYLTMSLGGMLGGLFNALFAPVVFRFVSEFPISLVGALFLLPPISALTNPSEARTAAVPFWRGWTIWDIVLPLLFFAAARFLSAYYTDILAACSWLIVQTGVVLSANTAATIIAIGLPTLVSYFVVERPLRFGACVAAIWIGTFLTFQVYEKKRDIDRPATVYTRSYFGTIKIESTPRFTRLIHGTTVHGSQFRDPDLHSLTQALWLAGANSPADSIGLAWIAEPHYRFPGREPLTYYHRTGPVGDMFRAFWDKSDSGTLKNTDVACIGLGTGTLSSYALPGQKMTFFEIDWKVRRLVEEPKNPGLFRDPEHFSYVRRARDEGANIEFLMGDARLSLEQTNRKWGLMLVDAFSSDSIPAHLLTRQAVQLYFDRLDDNGLLALHISNRYLRLEPVVDQIAKDIGCAALVMHDYVLSDSNYIFASIKPEVSGKLSSSWVVLARRPEVLAQFTSKDGWNPLEADESVGLWTDDFTPIRNVLQGEWNLFGK